MYIERWASIHGLFLGIIILVYSDIGPHIINATSYSPIFVKTQKEIKESLSYWDFFPDILQECPDHVFQAMFRGDQKVNFGNKFSILQTEIPPHNLSWPTEEGGFYLFHLFDPDVPSKRNHMFREYRHWTIANIPGTDIEKGDTLAEYVGILRNHSHGELHRHVFLGYKQPEKLTFDDTVIKKSDYMSRTCFSHRDFAQEYNLGGPIAVNFFQ